MSRFGNSAKTKFLDGFLEASIYADHDDLAARCKFNFSYFDVQPAGQDFEEWDHGQLKKLLNKLKDYSRESLSHWRAQPVGAAGTVLTIYGAFPMAKSDFKAPQHVPKEAQWGRFRLESAVRLVGFVLPSECSGVVHSVTKQKFDCNTFYVVFLDANHKFYKTEKK